ncbi:MAG: DUF1565 domain-containing protein [Candidatus Hydrogenedentota bacterium]
MYSGYSNYPKFIIIFLLIIFLSVIYSIPVRAAVWYVNDTSVAGDVYTSDTGNDTTGYGSDTKPYRTITKSLQVASAGDTIYVDAGMYSETDVIDMNNLSLIGADSSLTIIDPPGDWMSIEKLCK